VTAPYDDPEIGLRALAGSTVLQIVPALREEANARAAVNVARALLRSGARALVAADAGPLVNELKEFGGEWLPFPNESLNPLLLRRNARRLETIIAAERIDIVHAQGAGAAWSTRVAAGQIAVWFITSLPDVPARGWEWRDPYAGSLAQGDRIIAPSVYAATPVIERYGIPVERVTVIPRAIDTRTFDPQAVQLERAASLRNSWQVGRADQVVVVPGRVAPWNGQILLPAVARELVERGVSGLVFVIVGEDQTYHRYARSILRAAQTQGVESLFRLVGHCSDMPAVLAAADFVAVPANEPPLLGRVVAQAQAMGKPVVTTDVGVLPEYIAAPPRIADDLRTGWTTKPRDPIDFARALERALALDGTAYYAMGARARQFAEYMFSPDSVAAATRAVYTSLLARDN
jgi:glycosyltransferase involved in cell wall biosynthesis